VVQWFRPTMGLHVGQEQDPPDLSLLGGLAGGVGDVGGGEEVV